MYDIRPRNHQQLSLFKAVVSPFMEIRTEICNRDAREQLGWIADRFTRTWKMYSRASKGVHAPIMDKTRSRTWLQNDSSTSGVTYLLLGFPSLLDFQIGRMTGPMNAYTYAVEEQL